MKKMNPRNLLLAAAVTALALVTPRLLADNTAPAKDTAPSCCSMGATTTALADTNGVAKPIPDLLKTCPVSGDKLGEMGENYTFIYKGQEVKFCCASCKKDFLKDPDKYLALIRAADKKTKN